MNIDNKRNAYYFKDIHHRLEGSERKTALFQEPFICF